MSYKIIYDVGKNMEYRKEEIKNKANYCLGCKVALCKKGCPLESFWEISFSGFC